MPHHIRAQLLRQRMNWVRKGQELGFVTAASRCFGISRKTHYTWWHRYAASAWDRRSLADRARRPNGLCRWCGSLPSCAEGQASCQYFR